MIARALVAFALGVWLAQLQSLLIPAAQIWLVLSIFSLLAIIFVRKFISLNLTSALGLIAAIAFGFTYASWRAQVRMFDALPATLEGVPLVITGVVASLPARDDRGVRFEFDVESVDTPLGVKIPAHISLGWFADPRGDDAPPLHVGERWRLGVKLKRPHGFVNPHGFDLEAWLLERNLRATGSVSAADISQRLDADAGRWQDRVNRLRERIRARIAAALGQARWSGVLIALAIGDQRSIASADWSLFNRAGISHLLSISGAHVTLFAAALAAGVTALWRRQHALSLRIPGRKVAAVVAILAAGSYALLSGFAVPAQRTFLMLTIAALGLWMGRAASPWSVLAWALAVVLLIDPWAVMSAGFWFSFCAVAVLFWLSAHRFGRVKWWRAAMAAQLAISLALAPIALALFQQVSLVGIVVNALAIPLVSFVIVPLALAWMVIPIDGLLALAHACIEALVRVVQWADRLPLGVWQQHAPPAWAIVLAGIGALWLIAPRAFPLKWLGGLVLLPMFTVMPSRPESGTFTITALDVGQGQAMVVQTQHFDLLYDTGPRWDAVTDAGQRIVVPYLRATGARLGAMIVSHEDADHAGGLASVLRERAPQWWMSSIPAAQISQFASPAPHQRCVAGQSWIWDGVTFTIVHPQAVHYDDADRKTNDLSCAIRIVGGDGATALLVADVELRAEAELVASGVNISAQLLSMPHHGSRTSSSDAFIEKVAPQVAVVNAGYRNQFGHPRADIAEKYLRRRIAVDRTDLNGAVRYRYLQGKWHAQRWREIEPRYWRDFPSAAS